MNARVLDNTGETMRAQEMVYKAVTQSVLLYRSEIWLVTGVVLKVLEGFHHWSASQITGMTATCGAGG